MLMHAYINIHTPSHIHYMDTCLHTHACMHACIRMSTPQFSDKVKASLHYVKFVNIYICMYVFIYIHTHIHTYIEDIVEMVRGLFGGKLI